MPKRHRTKISRITIISNVLIYLKLNFLPSFGYTLSFELYFFARASLKANGPLRFSFVFCVKLYHIISSISDIYTF